MYLSHPGNFFFSSSLTTRVSLLSLSDKSTVDVVENLDVDYATGYWVICSPCAILPRVVVVGGLWSVLDGVGCECVLLRLRQWGVIES